MKGNYIPIRLERIRYNLPFPCQGATHCRKGREEPRSYEQCRILYGNETSDVLFHVNTEACHRAEDPHVRHTRHSPTQTITDSNECDDDPDVLHTNTRVGYRAGGGGRAQSSLKFKMSP
ncbi:hypothetical protein E2C01_049709 [Portunus trituberculatus]|uniref:Uncharacterized protein n=1 Tax=Portunus trituberculatus TaxID=210409 RepID=A0A5B7GEJ3_PORTR|nr:hypothetical protein [Portunus trituberculatus]